MANVEHVLDEFRTSLHWLVPLSLITTALLGRWSFPTRSHCHEDPRDSSCLQRRSSTRAQPWKLTKHRKDRAMFMPGGRDKVGCYDLWEKMSILEKETPQNHPLKPRLSFMDLPVEIRLSILECCAPIPSERQGANSMDTFVSLLRVSKAIQYEAYKACLPRIPLALWTKKGVRSFRNFLLKNSELGCLVRYLWIGTGKYDDEELSWAVDILKAATQLRSFACGEFLLARAVNANALVGTCETLTLMNVEKEVVYQARGIKQLRLCAGTYSTKERFPNVVTLCFNARRMNAVKDERVKIEYEAVDRWLESLERFVIVERDMKRVSNRGLGMRPKVKRPGRADMFSLVLPARWTEWDIWSADVVAAGVWDLCSMANTPAK